MIDPYGSLVVRDLDSKNGVHLDNRRIDKAIVPLGIEVRIGLVTLRAELTDEETNSSLSESTGEIYDLAETEKVRVIRPDDDRYEIG